MKAESDPVQIALARPRLATPTWQGTDASLNQAAAATDAGGRGKILLHSLPTFVAASTFDGMLTDSIYRQGRTEQADARGD